MIAPNSAGPIQELRSEDTKTSKSNLRDGLMRAGLSLASTDAV